jgi:hypothetical protein
LEPRTSLAAISPRNAPQKGACHLDISALKAHRGILRAPWLQPRPFGRFAAILLTACPFGLSRRSRLPQRPEERLDERSHAFKAPLCPSTCHLLSATLRKDSHRPASSALEPRKSKVFHLACGPPPDSEESLGRALPTFPPSASQIAGTGPTLHPKIQGWLGRRP